MQHVKINGVWYRLAEDAEGDHYVYGAEPLRPPNAQIVQGDSVDFQLRPDLLQWSITNWSGGEGRLKWSTDASSEHYILQGVDPFSRPGMLQLGYKEYITQTTGPADFTVANLVLGVGRGKLWAFSTSADQVYSYAGGTWSAGSAANGVAQGTACTAGTEDYVFYVDTGNDINVYDGVSWATHNDQIPGTTGGTLVLHGDYLYYYIESAGQLYEVSAWTANTSTPETPLYEFRAGDVGYAENNICAADGRVYFYTADSERTVVHEVVPTSAAGTGYGRILATFEGLHAIAIWYLNGLIYLLVDSSDNVTGSVGPDRQVYYIDPGGSYGTLGTVRGLVRSPSDHGIAPPAGIGGYGTYGVPGRIGRAAFSIPPTDEEQDKDDVAGGLFEVSSLTGGIAAVGRYPTSITAQPSTGINNLIYHDGNYYLYDGTQQHVIQWNTSVFTEQTGYAITPTHDFNLASEKILESIDVNVEELQGGEYVEVFYSVDDGAWVSAGTVSTIGDTGSSLTVSTDSSTVTFRSLRIKIALTPASFVSPVVKAVNVFARVNRRIRTWSLLVDCSDGSAAPGYDGAKLMDNLKGLAENTVIDFVDNYQSHNPEDGGDQYDVVVDAIQILASQPGEGVALVRLIEVT